jgi:hypothetical protein
MASISTKLQTADIGTERITCLDTWRSNCILINLCEPGVDATQPRALLSSLHRATQSKSWIHAKSNSGRRLWNVLGRTQALPAHAGVVYTQVPKEKTNQDQVIYDDPAAHSCLCCEDYDTDCEPTCPCEDFQDIDLWNHGSDGVDCDSNMQRVPCEQIPGQLCRLCDDDECVDRNVTCATLAIYYQHTVIDFTRGDQKPAEMFPGDDDDTVEDTNRVQDPIDACYKSVVLVH